MSPNSWSGPAGRVFPAAYRATGFIPTATSKVSTTCCESSPFTWLDLGVVTQVEDRRQFDPGRAVGSQETGVGQIRRGRTKCSEPRCGTWCRRLLCSTSQARPLPTRSASPAWLCRDPRERLQQDSGQRSEGVLCTCGCLQTFAELLCHFR